MNSRGVASRNGRGRGTGWGSGMIAVWGWTSGKVPLERGLGSVRKVSLFY